MTASLNRLMVFKQAV